MERLDITITTIQSCDVLIYKLWEAYTIVFAVIIYNNQDGPPIRLLGDDAAIAIPVVHISKADGILLAAAIKAGPTTISLQGPCSFSQVAVCYFHPSAFASAINQARTLDFVHAIILEVALVIQLVVFAALGFCCFYALTMGLWFNHGFLTLTPWLCLPRSRRRRRYPPPSEMPLPSMSASRFGLLQVSSPCFAGRPSLVSHVRLTTLPACFLYPSSNLSGI